MDNLEIFTCHTPSPMIINHGRFLNFHLPHPLTWEYQSWTIFQFSPATPTHLGSSIMDNLKIFTCHTHSPGIINHGQFLNLHLPHPLTWDYQSWTILKFSLATPPHLGSSIMDNLEIFTCHTHSPWIMNHWQPSSFHLSHPLTWYNQSWTILPLSI